MSFMEYAARPVWSGLFALCFTICSGCAAIDSSADDIVVAPLDLPSETQVAVLLFHGRDRGGDPIWNDIAERFESLLAGQPGRSVVNFDWSAGSDVPGRTAANATIYGGRLAEELAELDSLTHIHMVAHSAGSYVINDLCRFYRQQASNTAHIELTFLDPFGNVAVNSGDGASRRYGSCADYAAAYVNSDDRVPTTNSFLNDAYNFDVTNSLLRREFGGTGHDWPVQYFLSTLSLDLVDPGTRRHDESPRGEVYIVE